MQTKKNWCKEFTDAELVQKSLENMDNFVCLFERYEIKLLRYIQRISAFSLEEAEEVLQESFVKVWENLNEFDDSFKFSSWIYRIVHNVTISAWKKSRSFGKDQLIGAVEDGFWNNIPSDFNLPCELNKKLDKAKINQILQKLSPKSREILILKFLEEKNYQEISDILKKPSGTVATLINRAKKEFRALALDLKIKF